MSTLDRESMPIICAGTDTQPPCRHYKASSCWHPRNLHLDLVVGKLRPRQTPDFMRRHNPIEQLCGRPAYLYEAQPAPSGDSFLQGSQNGTTPPDGEAKR